MRTAKTRSVLFGALLAASAFAPTALAQQPPASEQQPSGGQPPSGGQQPSGEQQPSGGQQPMTGEQGAERGQHMSAKQLAMSAEKMSTSATVTKVDKSKRRLTLRDAEGQETTVTVPKEVKRFDQLKKGDRINITYYESVGVSLKRSESGAQPSGTETIGAATTAGKLPGGMMAREITANATVEKVDTSTNEITIKTPDGTKHTVHVTEPSLQKDLANLKPGDVIQAQYTEAVAITVQQPQKEGQQQKSG